MEKVQLNWRAEAIAALEKRVAEDAEEKANRLFSDAQYFVKKLVELTGAPITMSHFNAQKNEVVFDGIRFAERRYYTSPVSKGDLQTFIIETRDDSDAGETYDAIFGPVRNTADIGRYLKGELPHAPGSLKPIPKPPDSDFYAHQARASLNGDDREIQQGIIFGLVAVAKAVQELTEEMGWHRS